MAKQIFLYIHHIKCQCRPSNLRVVMEAQTEGHDAANATYIYIYIYIYKHVSNSSGYVLIILPHTLAAGVFLYPNLC